MSTDKLIQNLEAHWDTDGFLYAIRSGTFQPNEADAFLSLLRSIAIKDDEFVPKRLLSLLWYLPLFLEWQKERVAEVSPLQFSPYEHFVTEVQNTLEQVLGVP